MGVDANLYLNPRWDLDDIKKVLERTQGEKVEVRSNHSISTGFFNFQIKGRSISVFTNSQLPTGPTTTLMMSSNDKAIKMLTDIADVLGGILMKSDSDGLCEVIQGNMWDEDGLAYFIKHAILIDGIDPDDTQGFIDSKRKWHKDIEKKDMPSVQ